MLTFLIHGRQPEFRRVVSPRQRLQLAFYYRKVYKSRQRRENSTSGLCPYVKNACAWAPCVRSRLTKKHKPLNSETILLCDIHMKNLFRKLSNCKSLITVLRFFLTAAWPYGNAWRIRSSLFIPGCWSHVHNWYWHAVEWRRRTDLWKENTSGDCLDEMNLFFIDVKGKVVQLHFLTRGAFHAAKNFGLNFRNF